MLNRRTLLISSLTCYWKNHLALVLGVMVGTAVISGALIVGDSVRESLNRLTLLRLGQVSHVLTGPRFFREQLAEELQKHSLEHERSFDIAPALIFATALQKTDALTQQTLRANRVNLYGMEQRGWELLDHGPLPPPKDDEIYLNRRTALQLGATPGSEIIISIMLPSSVPRDSLLGKKDDATTQIPFRLKEILPDHLGASRFSLRADQQIPLIAMVSLATLQTALDLATEPPSRDNPEGKIARVNSLLIATDQENLRTPETATLLSDELRQVVQLRDLDLRLVPQPQYQYLALESQRMILEPPFVEVGENEARATQSQSREVLVYLANRIRNPNQTDPQKNYSMYSTVAGLNLGKDDPFRPEDFVGTPPAFPLQPRDVLINEWLAEDLQVKPGDQIDLSYFTVGSRGELPEQTEAFTVRGILRLEGQRASDRGLVPQVKGITDAKRLADWDQPFDMRFDLITQRDEDYWSKYKATPKLFIPLDTAQQLWKSRYGVVTSLLFNPSSGQSLEQLQTRLQSRLLSQAPLLQIGMQIQPLRAQGLSASVGTTDFSGLFIGFSLFLILSSAILVGLLFRLGLEQRVGEIGLWMAIGATPRFVARLFLAEHLLVLLIGGLLGTGAGVIYARIMIYGLSTWWVAAIRTTELQLKVTPTALIVGFLIAFGMGSGTLIRGLRKKQLLSLRGLLAGQTIAESTSVDQTRNAFRAFVIAALTIGAACTLLVCNMAQLLPGQQAFGGLSWNTVTFFLAGLLLLAGFQSFLSWLIATDRLTAVRGRGRAALRRLGIRNAARNRSRTVQTVGLVSTATFMIVAVASGQRNPAKELPVKDSGNGGFTLVAEADTPLLFDLNTPQGRLKFGLNDPEALDTLKQTEVVPFRKKEGDNASCLNLYQSQLPTILGVSRQMIDRGGFRFVDPPSGKNPWQILQETLPDGSTPVLGDMNTLMYSMHKGVGQTIPVDVRRPDLGNLKISGMFDGSVFQGVLLMSEENFLRLFPDQPGYRYFLIDTPLEKVRSVSDLLESRLTDYGFDADRVADRLAEFLSVQNTYLSTFQTLGGLGLLMGTLGLATVMLRNVLERQGEIALLQSVGFRRRELAALILWETATLLTWGLASGTLTALLAMGPHLLSVGADVPWVSGACTLVLIFIGGMVSAWGAIRAIDRTPILQSLRIERL